MIFALFWWFVRGKTTFIGPKADGALNGHAPTASSI